MLKNNIKWLPCFKKKCPRDRALAFPNTVFPVSENKLTPGI